MRTKYLNCKLRSVLLFVLKRRRWQHMQDIWTTWMRAETAAPDDRRMVEAPTPAEKRPAQQGASGASHTSESQDSDDDDDREVHHRRDPAARDRALMPPPPPPAKGGRARGTKRDAKRARGGGKGAFSVWPGGICSRDGRIISGQPSGYLRAPL